MALFLRLWMARHRYEQLRPHGRTSSERLRFHLRQLQQQWSRVIEFQKALGLDMVPFAPPEQFENIVVAGGYVQRELEHKNNTVIDLAPLWQVYTARLEKLSHQMNPFEFGDACGQCAALIRRMNGQIEEADEKIIPLPSPAPAPESAEDYCSLSGRSR